MKLKQQYNNTTCRNNMNKKNRLISFSVIYWLLFLISTTVIFKLYFYNHLADFLVVHDLMGTSEKMPFGLRTLLSTLPYWWAYVSLGIIIYLGSISKLRRYSLRIHLSALLFMLLVVLAWVGSLYWLTYILPTV